jgi:hypothetical protein
MTVVHLIRAYSGGAAGLAFRLRLTSPYDALAERLAPLDPASHSSHAAANGPARIRTWDLTVMSRLL